MFARQIWFQLLLFRGTIVITGDLYQIGPTVHTKTYLFRPTISGPIYYGPLSYSNIFPRSTVESAYCGSVGRCIGIIRRQSTRGKKGRTLLAIKKPSKARTVVGRGGGEPAIVLLCDPGSELRVLILRGTIVNRTKYCW